MPFIKGLNQDPIHLCGNIALVLIYAHEAAFLAILGYTFLTVLFVIAALWAAYGLIAGTQESHLASTIDRTSKLHGEIRVRSLIGISTVCYALYIWHLPGMLPALVYPCIIAHALICRPSTGLWGNVILTLVLSMFSLMFTPNVLAATNALPLLLTSIMCYLVIRYIANLRHDLSLSATRDPITNCHNEKSLIEDLEHSANLKQRYDHDSTLLLFKLVNMDEIRHQMGQRKSETFINEFANVIRSRLRTTDQAYRYDPKTFIVLLTNTTKKDSSKVHDDLVSSIEAYEFSNEIEPNLVTKQVDNRKSENWEAWLNRSIST